MSVALPAGASVPAQGEPQEATPISKKRSREDDIENVEEKFSPEFQSFFQSPRLSDLTLKVDDTEFKIHKVVVCARSEYFRRIYDANHWAESDKAELTLHGESPSIINSMLKFVYGFKYGDIDSESYEKNGNLSIVFQVKLYQAADKYFIPQLKKAAKKKIAELVIRDSSSLNFISAIPSPKAYSSTIPQDKHIRPIFVEASVLRMHELLKNLEFVSVLENTRGFITDLATQVDTDFLQFLLPSSRHQCPTCFRKGVISILYPRGRGHRRTCLYCGVAPP